MARRRYNDLYNEVVRRFWEQFPMNTFDLQIASDPEKTDWEKKDYPLFIDFVQLDSSGFLFTLKEYANSGHNGLGSYAVSNIRFSLPDTTPRVFGKEGIAKSYFFWIDSVKKEKDTIVATIKYLKHGPIKTGTELEFAYGDVITKYIVQYAKTDKSKGLGPKEVNDRLNSWFTYEANDGDYVLLKTFPNDPRNVHIIGSRSYIDVLFEDDKHMAKKIVTKRRPQKYEDFVDLTIMRYDNIFFTEKSQAKAAQELISGLDKKGDSLMELWNKYSEIEVRIAKDFKEKVGDIRISDANQLKDSVVRVKLNLTQEQDEIFSNDLDEILNSSFEFTDEKGETVGQRLSVVRINTHLGTMDLFDEDYLTLKQGEKGTIRITTIGTEIMDSRRKKALRQLRENPNFLLQNLHLAIEGQAEAMLNLDKKKYKPLTERTRKFIKNTFGIDDLTPDQKLAVEYAINTPDIVVIQGPPGTGKSTVVSVIAERLMEIAEKESDGGPDNKVILVSAFQNDTVEHIASKIYTLGIPSIKVGKDTQSIRVQDEIIRRMKGAIDNSMNGLAPEYVVNRVSKQLVDLQGLYAKESSKPDVKTKVDEILRKNVIDPSLATEWRLLNRATKTIFAKQDELISALKGLRTDACSYDDDGYEKVLRLQMVEELSLTHDEKDLLDSAPDIEPSEDFLTKLSALKEKYLNEAYAQENSVEGGTDDAYNGWFDKAIDYFRKQESKAYKDEDTFLMSVLEEIRVDLEGSSDYILASLTDYAQSIAATNQVAGSKQVGEFTYENVILEEAARSNPLDLLIPMSKAKRRIIMVGDQKQLPHMLERNIAEVAVTELKGSLGLEDDSLAEKKNQYELSLFGIIYDNLKKAKPMRYIQLSNQFRMHPVIGEFISKTFYHGNLSSQFVNADNKKHGLSLPWAKDKVVVWCDVPKSKGLERSRGSKERLAEARRIVALLNEIKEDPASRDLSIGIITFYSKQEQLIFAEAASAGYTERNQDGSYNIAKEYKMTRDGREKLRIGSVDSFQGKEFDIVILSTVRSNTIERLDKYDTKVFGFLMLENRLNVAFSRAQKLLITVGDREMFSDDFAKANVEGLYEFNQLVAEKYGSEIQ